MLGFSWDGPASCLGGRGWGGGYLCYFVLQKLDLSSSCNEPSVSLHPLDCTLPGHWIESRHFHILYCLGLEIGNFPPYQIVLYYYDICTCIFCSLCLYMSQHMLIEVVFCFNRMTKQKKKRRQENKERQKHKKRLMRRRRYSVIFNDWYTLPRKWNCRIYKLLFENLSKRLSLRYWKRGFHI